MSDLRHTPEQALKTLAWPLRLTRAGMVAERAARAFWPLWTVLAVVLAALLFGVHEHISRASLIAGLGLAALAVLAALVYGLRRFRWPSGDAALARLDATLPGRPITALGDVQAIGAGDAASEAVWRAHVARMAKRVKAARAVEPDLKLSSRDRYGLRYLALIAVAVGLLFGSLWRVGSVADGLSAPGQALAGGPSWEGWVEPPAYTGKPSLYLNDITAAALTVPQGSHVTLRFYGEPGALSVAQDISTTAAIGDALSSRFAVEHSGTLSIDGPGGRDWQVIVEPDVAPTVMASGPIEPGQGGEIRQPFRASDDYGVTAGRVRITLDLDAVDRRFGLTVAPEPRDAIVVDLPMPISGNRKGFEETLVENFSQHPWARLPVTMTFEVSDRLEQTGQSAPVEVNLGGRRFFDPVAAALIEMRRDLLWSRENGPRVVQVLRAVTYRPDDVFKDDSAVYLPLSFALRRLALGVEDGLTVELRDEIAQVLWDIAVQLEDGTLADAKARLDRAQERLAEAMRRGADQAEIDELMQDLNDAMQDYLRQLAENAQQQDQQTDQAENSQDMQEISPDQLQQMLDQIQELMEQGRMAEAMQLLDQLRQMMENMQVTQGQGGQQSPGQQAMEGLADTLREQQGLSDDAFRDLQEQFNPGAQAGRSQGNEGSSGGAGRGQSHEGQGEGQGDGEQAGEGQGGEQSLADRQRALRDELRRQQERLPGVGGEAGQEMRDALDRAGRAMDGAEEALRDEDIAEALDKQAEAMESLREGMRNLGEALAEQQNQNRPGQQGQQQGQAQANANRDPLGRERGTDGQIGSDGDMLGEELYDRSNELLDEIRRRSSEQERPSLELDYLRRLLERF